MLLLPDLIAFTDAYKDAQTNIEANIVVAEDSEVSKLITDIVNDGNDCTLITVIPSHDSEIKNEDTRQMRNNLIFFIVKKTDTKGGNSLRLTNFTLCQSEIIKLQNHIINIIDTNQDCLFRDVDYTNMPITPVADYFGQNGYMLEVFTKTSF